MSTDEWENDLLVCDGDRLLVRLRRTTSTGSSVLWYEYEPEFVSISKEAFLDEIRESRPENARWTITYSTNVKGPPLTYYILLSAPDTGHIRLKYCGRL